MEIPLVFALLLNKYGNMETPLPDNDNLKKAHQLKEKAGFSDISI